MYFLIDLSLGCVSFWITQTYGVNQFKNVFMAFCAGGIMPLDFYPVFLRDTPGPSWPFQRLFLHSACHLS